MYAKTSFKKKLYNNKFDKCRNIVNKIILYHKYPSVSST